MKIGKLILISALIGSIAVFLYGYRKDAWNKIPWDPQRCWVRRRLEKNFNDSITADTYLMWLLGEGIKYEIKKIINDFN